MPTKSFYFYSERPAIRYILARRLRALDWLQKTSIENTDFSDYNLSLNDEVSKNLEYKHLLYLLSEKYCKNSMPQSYLIDDHNYQQVLANITMEHYMRNNVYSPTIDNLKWILKPSMLNNGDDIRLFNNVDDLKKHFASHNRMGGIHLIQRYINNPDLINNRKYTIRIPMILTNYAGAFVYNDGSMNISAVPYQPEQGFSIKKMHITNYVIDGEYANIEQKLLSEHQDFSHLFDNICFYLGKIIKGIINSYPKYLKPSENKIFEIFGCDFALDKDQKLWLLEINQGPDAPVNDDHVLFEMLWDKYWQDIVEQFVIPIANKNTKVNEYPRFTRILSQSQCYSKFNLLKFWH